MKDLQLCSATSYYSSWRHLRRDDLSSARDVGKIKGTSIFFIT